MHRGREREKLLTQTSACLKAWALTPPKGRAERLYLCKVVTCSPPPALCSFCQQAILTINNGPRKKLREDSGRENRNYSVLNRDGRFKQTTQKSGQKVRVSLARQLQNLNVFFRAVLVVQIKRKLTLFLQGHHQRNPHAMHVKHMSVFKHKYCSLSIEGIFVIFSEYLEKNNWS